MTLEEIEMERSTSEEIEFVRHPLEAPELTMHARFYPLGFPVDLHTNSAVVLQMYASSWSSFEPRYNTEPISVDVHLSPSEAQECPPTPAFRMTLPLLMSIADQENYSIVDLARGTTQICITDATMRHPLYASYFFLESAAACHVATRHATVVHAACVEWNGRGMLLCGESGAGKSTLAYGCAKAGFGYITDDATFLLGDGAERMVTGNSRKVRLRPESATLFPEMKDLAITPRAAGKPSVEIATDCNLISLDETRVEAIVFLNRSTQREELIPYDKNAARGFMRESGFGLHEQRARQHRSLEQLLRAPVYEMHYKELPWAIARLKTLVQEGC
jgi:hypothetical protein